MGDADNTIHKVKFPFIREVYSGPMDGEFVDDVKTWKPGTRCEHGDYEYSDEQWMADGSRSIESRSRRALELLDRIRATHHSPPEGMAGWKPLIEAPNNEIVLVAAEFDGPGDWRIKCGYLDGQTAKWRVFGASWEPTHWMPLPAPPLPASEAKEASHADKA